MWCADPLRSDGFQRSHQEWWSWLKLHPSVFARNGATGRFPESESLCITSDFESIVLQLYSIATFPVTEDSHFLARGEFSHLGNACSMPGTGVGDPKTPAEAFLWFGREGAKSSTCDQADSLKQLLFYWFHLFHPNRGGLFLLSLGQDGPGALATHVRRCEELPGQPGQNNEVNRCFVSWKTSTLAICSYLNSSLLSISCSSISYSIE